REVVALLDLPHVPHEALASALERGLVRGAGLPRSREVAPELVGLVGADALDRERYARTLRDVLQETCLEGRGDVERERRGIGFDRPAADPVEAGDERAVTRRRVADGRPVEELQEDAGNDDAVQDPAWKLERRIRTPSPGSLP